MMHKMQRKVVLWPKQGHLYHIFVNLEIAPWFKQVTLIIYVKYENYFESIKGSLNSTEHTLLCDNIFLHIIIKSDHWPTIWIVLLFQFQERSHFFPIIVQFLLYYRGRRHKNLINQFEKMHSYQYISLRN